MEERIKRVQGLCHAIQSGVAWEMTYDATPTTPKHLRTGVNLAMVYDAAVTSLLIKKGIFTEAEYYDSLIEKLTEEKLRYEAALTQRTGTRVTLA